jgi:hypothetical protein
MKGALNVLVAKVRLRPCLAISPRPTAGPTYGLNDGPTHQTYAIRLAVEGGGQVKAESGGQSLKRIETAADPASGGLGGLGRQAELRRTGIFAGGCALIGAATVGGLGALIDHLEQHGRH